MLRYVSNEPIFQKCRLDEEKLKLFIGICSLSYTFHPSFYIYQTASSVCLCVQVSHRQYVFLMHLQRSIKALQQTLQQDLEEMGSKRERKDPSQRPADHQPFTVCLGLLLKSTEVSLLLKPVPQAEGSGSPLVSELSPSESRGTLEPGSDAGEGVEKAEKGSDGSGSDRGATKGSCTVDQLLCDEGSESVATQGPAPLIPTSTSTQHPELNHKPSLEERTSVKNAGTWSSDEGGEVVVDGLAAGDEMGVGLDSKTQTSDPLSDRLSSKDKAAAAKMPQSISRYSVCHTKRLIMTNYRTFLLKYDMMVLI